MFKESLVVCKKKKKLHGIYWKAPKTEIGSYSQPCNLCLLVCCLLFFFFNGTFHYLVGF